MAFYERNEEFNKLNQLPMKWASFFYQWLIALKITNWIKVFLKTFSNGMDKSNVLLTITIFNKQTSFQTLQYIQCALIQYATQFQISFSNLVNESFWTNASCHIYRNEPDLALLLIVIRIYFNLDMGNIILDLFDTIFNPSINRI